MAVKNGARFLARTLDSLFLETREDDEVIAVDDGSRDHSVHILSGYPVTLLRCPPPGGLARARNLGLEHARGTFVTFLDQDDLVVRSSFSARLDFLDRNPSINAVAGEIAGLIDEKEERLGDFYERTAQRRGERVLTWELLKTRQGIPGAIWLYLFRKEFLKSLGPFAPEWDPLCDQEFLYRVLKVSSLPCLGIPVAHYRIHDSNTTVRWQEHRIVVSQRIKALATLLAIKYGLDS